MGRESEIPEGGAGRGEQAGWREPCEEWPLPRLSVASVTFTVRQTRVCSMPREGSSGSQIPSALASAQHLVRTQEMLIERSLN